MALKFKDLERRFKVAPGRRVRLKAYDPGWAGQGAFKKEVRAEQRRLIELARRELTVEQ